MFRFAFILDLALVQLFAANGSPKPLLLPLLLAYTSDVCLRSRNGIACHVGHHAKFEKKKACRIDGEGVMMLYPLYRAVQKLWLNRKTYLFLLIEVCAWHDSCTLWIFVRQSRHIPFGSLRNAEQKKQYIHSVLWRRWSQCCRNA